MPFAENASGPLKYMTASNITAVHAFTTRFGGVSKGIYASLNLGENRGDAPENVRNNYKILCSALGMRLEDMVFSRQVHRAEVRAVGPEDRHDLFSPVPYEADGLITAYENVPLIIFTADCVPILLHDPVRGAIGAVHAGWRGTVADIAGNAVNKMSSLLGCDPGNIRAAIGPCISFCCFETGPEVPDAVRLLIGAKANDFITRRSGRFLVDLRGINRYLLERTGLKSENILVSDECTSCLCDKYWSHRRTNGMRGSQASVIMMKGCSSD